MTDSPSVSPAQALDLEPKDYEVESLRAQFASFADRIQEVEVRVSNSSEWGHMRPMVLASLGTVAATARKMAAGQPAYFPTYKIRAEKAEAELEKALAKIERLRAPSRATPEEDGKLCAAGKHFADEGYPCPECAREPEESTSRATSAPQDPQP